MKPKNLPEMWHDLPTYMREEEIEKSDDKELLSWISQNDKDIPIRIAAINKMDPEMSKQILVKLSNDKIRKIRMAAGDKLNQHKGQVVTGSNTNSTGCVKCGGKKVSSFLVHRTRIYPHKKPSTWVL